MNKRDEWTGFVMLGILGFAGIRSVITGPWWLPAIAFPIGWLILDRM